MARDQTQDDSTNGDLTGGWLFDHDDVQDTALHYRGETPEQPGPSTTGASPVAHASSTPRRVLRDDHTESAPASAAVRNDRAADTAPARATHPTTPATGATHRTTTPAAGATTVSARSTRRRGGGARTGALTATAVGVGAGLLVCALGWSLLPRPSAQPPVVPAVTTLAPDSPVPTRAGSSEPATPSLTATPNDSVNDASNRLGWTYIIDGLGPITLGSSARDAVALGVLSDVPSACSSHSPTDVLGDVQVYASDDGKVSAIDLRNPAFASGRGIRVGTSLATLQQTYGDALVSSPMSDRGTTITQWALLSQGRYIAYLVNGDGTVERIVIGARAADGSITLPPPC